MRFLAIYVLSIFAIGAACMFALSYKGEKIGLGAGIGLGTALGLPVAWALWYLGL